MVWFGQGWAIVVSNLLQMRVEAIPPRYRMILGDHLGIVFFDPLTLAVVRR